jgi:hypothetical protein
MQRSLIATRFLRKSKKSWPLALKIYDIGGVLTSVIFKPNVVLSPVCSGLAARATACGAEGL